MDDPNATTSGRRPTASIFLPLEHGSWALALEPLALGLLVAPSPAGVALTTAALAGFFACRPLKASLDRSDTEARRAARWVLLLFGTLALAGLGGALLLGSPRALWPLLLAAPFGGVFIYFDAQGDSRAALAELSGSAAFAFLPAAFATLAGWHVPAALALAALALARSIPTVLTVRTYLRLRKGKPALPAVSLLAAALALGTLAILAAAHQSPWLAVCGSGLLLMRTAWFVSPRQPAWAAKRVGMGEAILGAVYLGFAAIAYHTNWNG